jgi:hypothetical protein
MLIRSGTYIKIKLFAIFLIPFVVIFLFYGYKINHLESGKFVGKYLLDVSTDNDTEKEIDQLLSQQFITSEGLLTSYQGTGLETNKSILLESQGQLMEYALQIKDKRLFESLLNNVETYFLAPKGYYYWRLNLPDLHPDNATALVDQLRILRSLDKAGTIFNEPTYKIKTFFIALNLYRYNREGNVFCDSFDGRIGKREHKTSLFYIDPVALETLSGVFPFAKQSVRNTLDILKNAPNNGLGFFPAYYDSQSKSYVWPEKFTTAEQLYTVDYAQKAGMNVDAYLGFLSKSIRLNGKIFNAYHSDGSSVGVDDSAAVYALAARVFHQAKDINDERWCYERMLAYRINNQSDLQGAFAYETTKSAFTFDQMEALLTLSQEGKTTIEQ